MPNFPVTPVELAIAMALATVGSTIQGAVGFGLAVVTAPILFLLNPKTIFVPGPLLLAAMILTILIAHRERGSVAVREVGIATIGRVFGMLPAAYAFSLLDQRTFGIVFAAVILLGVLLSASGLHLRPTPGQLLAASALSGFAGTMTSVGGPPLALVYQHQAGPHIRGTLSAIFTVGTVISVFGLWWVGKFGVPELIVGLSLTPAVIAGFYLSQYATPYIDRASLRPAILVITVLSAAAIVVRAIMSSPGQ